MDKILNLTKENEKLWNSFLDEKESSTFFHTLEWKEIVEKVYGFKPLYFINLNEGNKVSAISPSFFTKSILFGKKIISTPFNFYNGPIFNDENSGKEIILRTINEAKKRNSKYVEFKFMNEIDESLVREFELKKNDHYFISNLKLSKSYEEIKNNYNPRLRKNLRTLRKNAERDNIFTKDLENLNELKQLHNIMVKTLRNKHHMISQPFDLFSTMYTKLREKNMIKILLSKKDKKIIAGMIILFFKDKAVYAWGVSDLNYKNYSPSSLLIDDAIKYCCENNCRELDFGVSSPQHPSLIEFKEKWGCTKKKLPYYIKLINTKEVPEMDYHTTFKELRKPFRYVPLWLIKKSSKIITKNLG